MTPTIPARRIPWNDLGQLKAAGLAVHSVHHGPGADTYIVADCPDELIARYPLVDVPTSWTAPDQTAEALLPPFTEQDPEPTPKPEPEPEPKPASLAGILADLLLIARRLPGHPQRRSLERGLQIDVMVRDGREYLQISRQGRYPSEAEWRAVLAVWPKGDPGTVPGKLASGGRLYLRGNWVANNASWRNG